MKLFLTARCRDLLPTGVQNLNQSKRTEKAAYAAEEEDRKQLKTEGIKMVQLRCFKKLAQPHEGPMCLNTHSNVWGEWSAVFLLPERRYVLSKILKMDLGIQRYS